MTGFSCPSLETPSPTTPSPTFLPSIAPTDIPSIEPTLPTLMPSNIPTNIPTNNPSYNPSNDPTFYPTLLPSKIPTHTPTELPSASPTTNPSTVPSTTPTVLPTTMPTTLPTTIPTVIPTTIPTAVPTRSPVQEGIANTSAFEFVDNNDIYFSQSVTINQNSATTNAESNFFNPGSRNVFETTMTIDLQDDSNIIELFEKWINEYFGNGNTNNSTSSDKYIDIDINWNIFDSEQNTPGIFNSSSMKTLQNNVYYMNAVKNKNGNNSYNNSFSIDSSFAVYPSQSINIYSVSTVCSMYDDEHFKSGHEYTFQVDISIKLMKKQTDLEDEIINSAHGRSGATFFANTPAVNGSCIVSPTEVKCLPITVLLHVSMCGLNPYKYSTGRSSGRLF